MSERLVEWKALILLKNFPKSKVYGVICMILRTSMFQEAFQKPPPIGKILFHHHKPR